MTVGENVTRVKSTAKGELLYMPGRYTSNSGGNQEPPSNAVWREDCCNSSSSQFGGPSDQAWQAEDGTVLMANQGTGVLPKMLPKSGGRPHSGPL